MAITIKAHKMPRLSRFSLCGVMAISLPMCAQAEEWRFVPTLLLRESYSDNIALAPQTQARSDFVSEITPGIAIYANTPRLTLNLSYMIQKVIYQHEPDSINHLLQAAANAKLVPEWLFVDAAARVSLQNISAFGPQIIDNTQITDNQRTLKAVSISPYLKHGYRGFAAAELRYTHEHVSTSDNDLSVNTDDVRLNLTGDNGGRGWNWVAYYDRNEIHDKLLAPVTMSSASLALLFPVTASIQLTATAGYEKNDYVAINSAPEDGRFWTLGAAWRPSERTSVSASVGKRYFGNTAALDASYRSRNTVWSVNYSDTITSSYSQFLASSGNDVSTLLNQLWRLQIPDPLLRQQAVDTFVHFSQALGSSASNINYISHRYYLQKQLSLSMAASSAKSTLVLSLSHVNLTAQTSSGIDNALLGLDQSTLEDRTRQSGANAGWSYRMSPRSSLNLNATYNIINSLDTGRRDNNLALSAGFTRQLQENISASIDVRHVRHNSTAGSDYRENAISATLNFKI